MTRSAFSIFGVEMAIQIAQSLLAAPGCPAPQVQGQRHFDAALKSSARSRTWPDAVGTIMGSPHPRRNTKLDGGEKELRVR